MLNNSVLATKIGGGNFRQSNLEALRIVAMSMILIHHFLYHGGFGPMTGSVVYPAINSFFFTGVNLFFLISGHFSIRFSGNGVVKFILTIMFFRIVNLLLLVAVGLPVSAMSVGAAIFFPISSSDYWFISVYFLLILSSPVINAGLNALPQAQLRKSLLIFTIAIIYMFGNHGSHNYVNAVYMYCVGYYLRKYGVASLFTVRQLAGVFLVSCVANTFYNLAGWKILHATGFAYDNILVIIGAVSLYMAFSKLSFTSKTVNRIAGCALGCYLLQDGQFGNKFFYDFQIRFLAGHGISLATLGMYATSFIGFWIASYVLTSFLNLWLKPASQWIMLTIRGAAQRRQWGISWLNLLPDVVADAENHEHGSSRQAEETAQIQP